MNQKNIFQRIARYVFGPADPKEAALLAETPELTEMLNQQWQDSTEGKDEAPAPDPYKMLLGVYHKAAIQSKIRKISLKKRILEGYKWAAILALPLILAGLAIYFTGNRKSGEYACQNPKGARSEFYLPDGSQVFLNSDSHLTYRYKNNKRVVKLEGEAFFKVKSDAANPFIVQTAALNVIATGTEFNVMAYPENALVKASLIEGKVTLESIDAAGNAQKIVMTAGQTGYYNKSDKSLVLNFLTSEHEWISGRLVFDGSPLSDVALQLERWFNIKIDIQDLKLESKKFTGSFTNKTLPEILEKLSATANIKYTLDEERRLVRITASQ